MKKAAMVGLLVLAVLANPVLAIGSKGDSGYWHPYPSGLVPGDIVMGHSPVTFFSRRPRPKGRGCSKPPNQSLNRKATLF